MNEQPTFEGWKLKTNTQAILPPDLNDALIVFDVDTTNISRMSIICRWPRTSIVSSIKPVRRSGSKTIRPLQHEAGNLPAPIRLHRCSKA